MAVSSNSIVMATLRGEVQGQVIWVSRPGTLPKVCIDCSEKGEHAEDIALPAPPSQMARAALGGALFGAAGSDAFVKKIAFQVWRCASCQTKAENRRRLMIIAVFVAIAGLLGLLLLKTELGRGLTVLFLGIFVIGGGIAATMLKPRELMLGPASKHHPDAVGGLFGFDPRAIQKMAEILSEREHNAEEKARREEAGANGYR